MSGFHRQHSTETAPLKLIMAKTNDPYSVLLLLNLSLLPLIQFTTPAFKKKLHSFWSLWLYGLLVLLLPRALHLSVSKFLHHLLPPPPSSADPMASNAICMPTPRYFYPLSSLHQSLQALRIASPPPMLVYRTSPDLSTKRSCHRPCYHRGCCSTLAMAIKWKKCKISVQKKNFKIAPTP